MLQLFRGVEPSAWAPELELEPAVAAIAKSTGVDGEPAVPASGDLGARAQDDAGSSPAATPEAGAPGAAGTGQAQTEERGAGEAGERGWEDVATAGVHALQRSCTDPDRRAAVLGLAVQLLGGNRALTATAAADASEAPGHAESQQRRRRQAQDAARADGVPLELAVTTLDGEERAVTGFTSGTAAELSALAVAQHPRLLGAHPEEFVLVGTKMAGAEEVKYDADDGDCEDEDDDNDAGTAGEQARRHA